MEDRLERILKVCSKYFNISIEDIKGRERYKKFIIPRHCFCFLAWKFTNYTKSEIARYINRDHTTVIHAIAMVNDSFDTKQYLYEDILKLIQQLEYEFNKSITKVTFTFDKLINFNSFTTTITEQYGAIKYEIIED